MIDVAVMRFVGSHHQHDIAQGRTFRQLPVMLRAGGGGIGGLTGAASGGIAAPAGRAATGGVVSAFGRQTSFTQIPGR